MKDELSILIPTYNRKEKLQNTLRALQKQFNKNFKIVILDNASCYSIEQEVLYEFDPIYRDSISVVHRAYNVGMGNNIAGLFSECKTKWGWLLGDDDIIQKNAIETVINTITSKPDYAGFWFSINTSYADRITITTVDELVDLKLGRDLFNDSCYLSNKVYNFEYIGCCSDVIYNYSYTMISFSLAIFEMLKHSLKFEIIFNEPIVKHPGFEDVTKPSWNFIRVTTGMRTITDYNVSGNKETQTKYIKGSFFPWKRILLTYLSMSEPPIESKYYLMDLYFTCYRKYLPLLEKIKCKILFEIASTNVGFSIGKRLIAKKRIN